MPGRQIHPEQTVDDFAVRPSTPADRPHVERLFREGLLPGHVEYESGRADEIRQSFGSARERFLVAEAAADGRIIGTVAVVEGRPDVAHLHWLRVDPAWQADLRVALALRRAAAEHARSVGLLKLATQVPAEAEQRVTAYYHRLGFEFSRAREVEGVHVLEFYLNLYETPELGGAT